MQNEVRLSIRVPKSLHADVAKVADQKNISMNDLIIESLTRILKPKRIPIKGTVS